MSYILIILVGASLQENDIRGSATMTALPQAYQSLDACQNAGERFRVEAKAAQERRPRYYCIPAQ